MKEYIGSITIDLFLSEHLYKNIPCVIRNFIPDIKTRIRKPDIKYITDDEAELNKIIQKVIISCNQNRIVVSSQHENLR
jgi:ribosomal protein L16 Arg81 hydroxylase